MLVLLGDALLQFGGITLRARCFLLLLSIEDSCADQCKDAQCSDCAEGSAVPRSDRQQKASPRRDSKGHDPADQRKKCVQRHGGDALSVLLGYIL